MSSGRIRGIRQTLAPGTVLGRTGMTAGAAQAVRIIDLLRNSGGLASLVQSVQSDNTVNEIPIQADDTVAVANNDLLQYVAANEDFEYKSPSKVLDTIGSARGNLLFRNNTVWTVLAPGTAGYVLQTNGAGADPTWVAAAAAGAAGGDLTGTYPNPTIAKIQTVTVSGVTGTGSVVFSNTPSLVTPSLGVAAATSIALSGGTALANYLEATYTPVVTLVGGAGNTVPVYSTVSGRYTRIGNRVFVDITLFGDGGAEGAGTGQVNITIPVAASAGLPSYGLPKQVGYGQNNATYYEILGYVAPSATVATLSYWTVLGSLSDFTGALQDNATRAIRLSFSYEV